MPRRVWWAKYFVFGHSLERQAKALVLDLLGVDELGVALAVFTVVVEAVPGIPLARYLLDLCGIPVNDREPVLDPTTHAN